MPVASEARWLGLLEGGFSGRDELVSANGLGVLCRRKATRPPPIVAFILLVARDTATQGNRRTGA